MALSEFVRFSTHLYAKEVREKHQKITLSKRDGVRFLQALDTPPEPNQTLIDAMRRYEQNTNK